MSALEAAQAALIVFPPGIQEVMVAIAGAESGWDNAARGDPVSSLPSTLCGVSPSDYACRGYTSFGAWQVNLPCNHGTIEQLSGVSSSDPCAQAGWLMASYDNAARAALAVYESQGFGAWSTYASGAYAQYLSAAKSAIAQAQEQTALPAIPPRGSIAQVGLLVVGIGSVLAAGITAALLLDPPLRQEVGTSVRRLWHREVS